MKLLTLKQQTETTLDANYGPVETGQYVVRYSGEVLLATHDRKQARDVYRTELSKLNTDESTIAAQLYSQLCELRRVVQENDWNNSDMFKGCGICGNVIPQNPARINLMLSLMRSMFKRYPEYSGNLAYPLKSLHPDMGPSTWFCFHNGNKYIGEQGAQRMHLLDWMINDLETYYDLHD